MKILENLPYFYNPIKCKCDFLIIDNFEPSDLLTGFRVKEFNHYLNSTENFKLLTFSPFIFTKNWKNNIKNKNIDWATPMSNSSYKRKLKIYLNKFNISADKFLFMQNRPYEAKGAYLMFLYNTYLAKNFLEKNKIPFVFTLFPGGGLRLNHEFSDYMLKEVFSSPMFKGCFVPQKIIYDYIIAKGFTTEDKLFFSYGGGFFQFTKNDVLPKKWYKKDKETFDISFVAYRYMKKGLDKGFDTVIYTLKELVKKYPFIHLHCVGTNTLDDFDDDFSDIQNNLHIYPSQKADFFPEFFANIDMALAPCRANVLAKGAFDGFPLTCEAGYFGVPIFCSDELQMNYNYKNGEELIIIKPNVNDVIEKIDYYINHLEELRAIGNLGQAQIQNFFAFEHQVNQRNKFLNKFLDTAMRYNNETK